MNKLLPEGPGPQRRDSDMAETLPVPTWTREIQKPRERCPYPRVCVGTSACTSSWGRAETPQTEGCSKPMCLGVQRGPAPQLHRDPSDELHVAAQAAPWTMSLRRQMSPQRWLDQ